MRPPEPEHTSTERQWLKISLFCPLILLESASDLMGVLSGSGIEQTPETETGATISGFFQLTAANEAPLLLEQTIGEIRAQVEQEMAVLFAHYGMVPQKTTVTLLADQDWATSWQQFFKPFEIIPGLVIKPSWETYLTSPGQHMIELDPGMAFGTGQHASTQMALSLIKESMTMIHPRKTLDVGTGTGILAMATALFGAIQVVAIDNDPEAVTVARDNVAQNALSEQITVSATPVEQITGPFPLICANIVHDVLVDMAGTLSSLTAPGGHLVLAGVLRGGQEENILRVYGGLGLHLLDRRHQEEWAALLLERL